MVLLLLHIHGVPCAPLFLLLLVCLLLPLLLLLFYLCNHFDNLYNQVPHSKRVKPDTFSSQSDLSKFLDAATARSMTGGRLTA